MNHEITDFSQYRNKSKLGNDQDIDFKSVQECMQYEQLVWLKEHWYRIPTKLKIFIIHVALIFLKFQNSN